VNRIASLVAVAAAAVLFAAPAHADVAGLSPFGGEWAGKRETVTIDPSGQSRFSYVDVRACPDCAMSDMPYASLDFVLTSVSGDTAAGVVTADKYGRAGQPVTVSLTSATALAPPTISWTIGGLDEGLFCPASNSRWCGG